MWLAITKIEAQEMLKASTISLYPNLKQSAREKLHREWHSQAYSLSDRKRMGTTTISGLMDQLKRSAPNGKG